VRQLLRRPAVLWLAGGVLFALLVTANGAGYRYGVSDQAFYIPVITHALHPDAFPRDGALIDAEGRLMVLDELLATLVRVTGVSLETLFLIGYLCSVALTWTGLVLIGTSVYRNPWATAALAALVTLRHRIPQTSANSLEPYFHPRMLAFGVGTLAVAAVLRRRSWVAIALVAVCAVLHITTALWFAVLIGVALATLDARLRRLAIAAAAAAALVLVWAATAGPLQSAAVTMDEMWLQAVASKDSLFATRWPVWAWVANLGLLAFLWWAHRWRVRRGLARPEDAALVWGATALVSLFLITLPMVAARWSLVVQFQISRIFWLVDFLAMVYLIAVIADRPEAARQHSRRGSIIALVLIAISLGRGAYILWFEFPERSLFEVRVRESPWEDAMRWLRRQPLDVHVLADPGHAWKYGTSVRVSAARDVFVEEVKDSALAIYSRDVATRVVDRLTAIGDFGALTAARARDLAQHYDIDYLVTTADLSLPLAYRNNEFRIYALR
jgi:hypothetical protein